MFRNIIVTKINGEAAEFHQKLVDSVAEKFGLRKINTHSHITLKDSFYSDNTTDVENIIEKVVSRIKNPQENKININGIDNFRNEIFYLNAELNKQSTEVFRDLLFSLKGLKELEWDEFDTLEREFHLTITNKARPDNYKEISEFLLQFQPDFELLFDNISIFRKIENEWIVLKEFKI